MVKQKQKNSDLILLFLLSSDYHCHISVFATFTSVATETIYNEILIVGNFWIIEIGKQNNFRNAILNKNSTKKLLIITIII